MDKKILIIELDEGSENEKNMLKSFVEQKSVILKGKVIEMHKSFKSYKEHLEDEKER